MSMIVDAEGPQGSLDWMLRCHFSVMNLHRNTIVYLHLSCLQLSRLLARSQSVRAGLPFPAPSPLTDTHTRTPQRQAIQGWQIHPILLLLRAELLSVQSRSVQVQRASERAQMSRRRPRADHVWNVRRSSSSSSERSALTCSTASSRWAAPADSGHPSRSSIRHFK